MRIGAIHADVIRTAGSFDHTGSTALLTGQRASVAASELETELASLDAVMVQEVERLIADLEQQLATHQTGLLSADWQGDSRTAALGHAEQLQAEAASVLAAARGLVAAFGADVRTQVATYRETVETELQDVLTRADRHYAALAEAARRFTAALQAADATITR